LASEILWSGDRLAFNRWLIGSSDGTGALQLTLFDQAQFLLKMRKCDVVTHSK